MFPPTTASKRESDQKTVILDIVPGKIPVEYILSTTEFLTRTVTFPLIGIEGLDAETISKLQNSILKNSIPVVCIPCGHHARISFARNICDVKGSCPDCNTEVKNIIPNRTLQQVTREIIDIIKKLKEGSQDQSLSLTSYYVGDAFTIAKQNQEAFLFNCGHSISKPKILKTLRMYELDPQKLIVFPVGKFNCKKCKITLETASPNLPLRAISQHFVRFIEQGKFLTDSSQP